MIDLITVLGADIFFLSILLYFREALFGWVRPCLLRFRALVERNGLLWPDRTWLESPDEFGRRLVYNLDVMEVPLRVALCALVAVAVAVSLGRVVA